MHYACFRRKCIPKTKTKVIVQEIVISNLGVFVKEKERKRTERSCQRPPKCCGATFRTSKHPVVFTESVHPVTSHFGWFRYVPDTEHYSRGCEHSSVVSNLTLGNYFTCTVERSFIPTSVCRAIFCVIAACAPGVGRWLLDATSVAHYCLDPGCHKNASL